MRQHSNSVRLGRPVLAVTIVALTATFAIGATTSAETTAKSSFSFRLRPAPGISACLPHATALVKITPTPPNDTMTVTISGVPRNNNFTLFVTQLPNVPFGVASYVTEIHVGSTGTGGTTVRGVFSVSTFAISVGGTTTFQPVHQYHLGLWFDNPMVPFNLGCESPNTSPVFTPFNGSQHAGIQVLNSGSYPVGAGPLSHVKT